jgi:hypothetical protein
MLADPNTIRESALSRLETYERRYGHKRTPGEIADAVADTIISRYARRAALVGGAVGLTSVVPGLGTVIAVFGGATADFALTMKYQIEMTMAIATVSGHDVTEADERTLCLLVAGLGVAMDAGGKAAAAISTKAFGNMVKRYLRRATAQVVREVLRRAGGRFARAALDEAIPFGVGVVIGFKANKKLTGYVGGKAKTFFKDAHLAA